MADASQAPSAMSCQIVTGNRRFGSMAFPDPEHDLVTDADNLSIVLGGGCFWCVEAVYRQLRGVSEVVSGYAGGEASTADYRSVCSGSTGHAEVIRIRFNPQQISYGQLLKVFFSVAHDPTQLNRQGNDRGTQYRSAIFYANETEKSVAERYIQQLNIASVFKSPIVTTLEPLTEFFPAEAYHQNYAALNPDQGYIATVSRPKVEKLKANYANELVD